MTTLETMTATANIAGRMWARGIDSDDDARRIMSSIALDCAELGYGLAGVSATAVAFGLGIREVMEGEEA